MFVLLVVVVLVVSVLSLVVVQPDWLLRRVASRSRGVIYHGPATARRVAITLDDGPHPTGTLVLLETLAELQVPATFFLIGERVDRHPEIARRIVDRGHEIGNHLWTATPSVMLTPRQFERQLERTHELLARYGAVRWVRPGSGWFTPRMLRSIAGLGCRCVLGSVYPRDTKIRVSDAISRYVLWKVRPGSIVILHDGRDATFATDTVLRTIVPALRQRGFELVTLSELLEGVAD